MRIVHLYADRQGESHFTDMDHDQTEVGYAPPAPPFLMSQTYPASAVVLATLPVGWWGDWHPTPVRQLFLQHSGVLDVAVSDGESRRMEAGAVVLLEDVIGKGHTTRVVGDEPVECTFVRLAK